MHGPAVRWQVNSDFIRSARFVLQKPGLSFGKSIVLCGGPDWPTSVLTGILKLNVFQMLLGSLPVIVFIVPSTALGSFLVMAGREGAWEAVSLLVTVFALGEQIAFSIGAVVVIQQAHAHYAEQIAKLPIDEEVASRQQVTFRHHPTQRPLRPPPSAAPYMHVCSSSSSFSSSSFSSSSFLLSPAWHRVATCQGHCSLLATLARCV